MKKLLLITAFSILTAAASEPDPSLDYPWELDIIPERTASSFWLPEDLLPSSLEDFHRCYEDLLYNAHVYFYNQKMNLVSSLNDDCKDIENRAVKLVGQIRKEASRLSSSAFALSLPDYSYNIWKEGGELANTELMKLYEFLSSKEPPKTPVLQHKDSLKLDGYKPHSHKRRGSKK